MSYSWRLGNRSASTLWNKNKWHWKSKSHAFLCPTWKTGMTSWHFCHDWSLKLTSTLNLPTLTWNVCWRSVGCVYGRVWRFVCNQDMHDLHNQVFSASSHRCLQQTEHRNGWPWYIVHQAQSTTNLLTCAFESIASNIIKLLLSAALPKRQHFKTVLWVSRLTCFLLSYCSVTSTSTFR